jgi:putative methyltransferase (TIGR04325 family)
MTFMHCASTVGWEEKPVAEIARVFPNYSSAAMQCGDGYSDSEIAKVTAYRTREWKRALNDEQLWADQFIYPNLAVGIAGADLTMRPLRVLDFGGGCGVHYFTARFVVTMPLKWAIVETRVMAEQAREVSEGEFEVYDEVAPTVASLGGVDLVLTSGAIQYTPDPLATLDALIGIGAPYFMLARFPFWGQRMMVAIDKQFLSKQAGGGPMPPGIFDRAVNCPITFVQFADVRSKFEQAYDRVMMLLTPSANYQFGAQTIFGASILYRRKA